MTVEPTFVIARSDAPSAARRDVAISGFRRDAAIGGSEIVRIADNPSSARHGTDMAPSHDK